MSAVELSNRQARRALLALNGLGPSTPGDGLPVPDARRGPRWARGMVRRLGFVQVDPICSVERAHHTILFSRSPRYAKEDLRALLEDEPVGAFENWTHDAAVLPIESFPYWRHYFERVKKHEAHPGYKRYFSLVTPADASRVLRRIRREGALRPRDVAGGKVKVDWIDESFPRPSVAKVAMELLWRTGKLAVARREGNEKVYDLTERVVPRRWLEERVTRKAYVDWACRQALLRLAVATPGQVARFFDAVSTDDATAWCRRQLGKDVVELCVEPADGSADVKGFALAEAVEPLRKAAPPPRRMRLLSPFDPLIHDRRRTARLFGFDYAIEIWVPPKKRKYGYYVLPILEGERLTGRVDSRVDRKQRKLEVLGLWWEAGVKPTPTRTRRLERELRRLARFAGVDEVAFRRGYDRR